MAVLEKDAVVMEAEEAAKKELHEKAQGLIDDYIVAFKKAPDLAAKIVDGFFDNTNQGYPKEIKRGSNQWLFWYSHDGEKVQIFSLSKSTFSQDVSELEEKANDSLRINMLEKDGSFSINFSETRPKGFKTLGYEDEVKRYDGDKAIMKGREMLATFINTTPSLSNNR
jgi:hypothetical protein